MTSHSADLDRYELVPGLSAYRLARVMRVVVIAMSVIFGVLGFVAVQSMKSDSELSGRNILTLVAVFGTPFLIIIGFSIALSLRGRAEAAAGYTTMTSGYQNLDQVDPVVGLVIRRAGSAVYTIPTHGGDTPGTVSGPVINASSFDNIVRFDDLPHARRNRILMLWGAGIVAIVIIAVILGVPRPSAGDTSADRVMFLGIGLLTFAGVAVLVAVVLLVTAALQQAKLRAAGSVRPEALAFITQRTPELIDALEAIGTDRPRLRQQFVVTLGSTGIELWGRGHTDVPLVALPWSGIDHVHPGRLQVASGNRSLAVLTLHIFRTVDGRRLDLPIPIFGRRGVTFARTDRANEVLDVCARYTRIA